VSINIRRWLAIITQQGGRRHTHRQLAGDYSNCSTRELKWNRTRCLGQCLYFIVSQN